MERPLPKFEEPRGIDHNFKIYGAPHPRVHGNILYLGNCPDLGAPNPKGTRTGIPQKIFEEYRDKKIHKKSVDRLIVQLQEVTRKNMKCEYRNTSGNTHFRAF